MYSGVTNSTPFAAVMADFSSVTSLTGLSSSSWLYSGRSAIETKSKPKWPGARLHHPFSFPVSRASHRRTAYYFPTFATSLMLSWNAFKSLSRPTDSLASKSVRPTPA